MEASYDYQRNKIKVKSIRLTSKDAKAISGEALVNLETATIASFSGSASATRTLDEAVAIDSYGWTSWSSHSISAFDAHSRGFVFCIPATDYPGGFTVSLIDEKGLVYSYDCGPVSVSGGEIAFLDYRPLTVYYGNANSVIVKPGDTSVTFDATPYCSFDRRFTRISESDHGITGSSRERHCQRKPVAVARNSKFSAGRNDCPPSCRCGKVRKFTAVLLLPEYICRCH